VHLRICLALPGPNEVIMKNEERNKYVSEEPQENTGTGLKRRDFFKLLGGGILILFQPWNAFDIMALPAEQARALPKDLMLSFILLKMVL